MFGFTLNAINIIPFYYLFLPTWVFSIVVYILLAKRNGAAQKYPEEEAELANFDKKVERFHAEQAANEPAFILDQRLLTKVLTAVAWLSLGVTVVLAANAMFNSPDVASYEHNRTLFFNSGFACTIIYFASAYWAMQRKKQFSAV